MKKNSLLILSILSSLFIGLTGCEDNATPEYTVTFKLNGGNIATATADIVNKVKQGEKAVKPTDPTREDFSFLGWQDANSKVFDFNTAISANITLTAGWKSAGAVSNVVIELDTTARPTEFRVASYVYTDGDGTVVPNSTAEVKWLVSDNSDGTSATAISTGATYSPVGVDRYKFVSASVRVKAAENVYTPEEQSTTSLFAGFSTEATAGSTNKFTARREAAAVKFNDKMWVIGGRDADSNYLDEVWSSADGATWRKETLTSSFGARIKHTVLSFNDTIWVIGGSDVNGSALNDVWSSEDGVKWTRVATAGFPVRQGHTSVVFNNKMWVIAGVGTFGDGRLADVWSSSDGTTWAQSTIPSDSKFPARFDHTSVVHDGKMWIIGGQRDGSNAGIFADVWSSEDGATWTQSTIPSGSGFPDRYRHTSVAYDSKIWVIGGFNGSALDGSALDDVWWSSDGATWKRALENAGFPERYEHTSVLFDNNIFVLGGNGDAQGVLDDVWY